jgi:hypothetical protein
VAGITGMSHDARPQFKIFNMTRAKNGTCSSFVHFSGVFRSDPK